VVQPTASLTTAAGPQPLGRLWPKRDIFVDCLITLILSLPFLITPYLPLTDLPNHLARQHILSDWMTSPALQQYYNYKWQLVPNLGVDLFVLAARAIVPIDLAVRIFCILAVSAIFWGSALINRHYAGRGARAYRLVPFLCYGGPVQFGFLNFVFGVGIALLVFGIYLRLRDARPGKLLAILVPSGAVLLLCHLMAFGICALAIGAFEFMHPIGNGVTGRMRQTAREILRRESRAAMALALPLAVFALFSPLAVGGHGARWSTLHEKIEGLAALTLFANPIPELLLLALAMAGYSFLLLSGAVRVRRESVLTFLVMLAIFLLLPRVAGGGGYVDYRMPWAASFFLVSGTIPARRMGLGGRAISVCLAGLAVARIALVAAQWLSWSPAIAEVVTALRGLPTGARLMVVLGDPGSTSLSRRPPLEHVAAYAVAYRQAYWAGMFADISGQILFYQPAYKHDWSDDTPRPALDVLDPLYQYVLVLRPQFARLAPQLPLRCVTQGKQFRLFAVTNHSDTLPANIHGDGCPAIP
jgi:hypothetical protein